MEKKYVVLPPMAEEGLYKVIPGYACVSLICAIPEGYLITEKELLSCLYNAYGVDRAEIQRHFYQSPKLKIDSAYPYWRVISERGHLIGAKESQMEHLQEEGFEIKVSDKMEQYVVKNYKSRLFDMSNLKISVMQSDREIADAIKYMMEEYNKNKCKL